MTFLRAERGRKDGQNEGVGAEEGEKRVRKGVMRRGDEKRSREEGASRKKSFLETPDISPAPAANACIPA